MEKQVVRINIKNLINLKLEEINPFQEEIKILLPEDYEAFKKEMLADGFNFAPHVWQDVEHNYWLLDGHQRTECLNRMVAEGFEVSTVPCVEVVAETLEEARRMVLAAASTYGTMQEDALSRFKSKTGLNADQLAERFRLRIGGLEKLTCVKQHLRHQNKDANDIPEVKIEVSARHGDIFLLGKNRLMCGDSTKKEDMELLMNGELADLWITDPPYGVDYVAKNAAVNGGIVKNAAGKEIKNDAKSVKELCPFWKEVAKNAFDFSTDKASHYWFACQGSDKMMMMMMMMMDEAGWNIRHELIWVKSSFVFGRSDYHYRHEPIIYGWKKDGTHEWHGDRKQDSVLEFDRPHKSDMHPTTKPVELIERLMANSSKEGQLVLDTFGGSGTTLVAAEKLGRRCNMIELDPIYVDVIVRRWELLTGEKAQLLTG